MATRLARDGVAEHFQRARQVAPGDTTNRVSDTLGAFPDRVPTRIARPSSRNGESRDLHPPHRGRVGAAQPVEVGSRGSQRSDSSGPRSPASANRVAVPNIVVAIRSRWPGEHARYSLRGPSAPAPLASDPFQFARQPTHHEALERHLVTRVINVDTHEVA